MKKVVNSISNELEIKAWTCSECEMDFVQESATPRPSCGGVVVLPM
jgi:hypothetical protein